MRLKELSELAVILVAVVVLTAAGLFVGLKYADYRNTRNQLVQAVNTHDKTLRDIVGFLNNRQQPQTVQPMVEIPAEVE